MPIPKSIGSPAANQPKDPYFNYVSLLLKNDNYNYNNITTNNNAFSNAAELESNDIPFPNTYSYGFKTGSGSGVYFRPWEINAAYSTTYAGYSSIGASVDCTIETWFNKVEPGGDGCILSKDGYAATWVGEYQLYIDTYNNLYFSTGRAGDPSYLQTFTFPTQITLNTWYHVAVVRQSGYWYFYLNGVQQNIIGTQTGNPSGNDNTGTWIGMSYLGGSFGGYISNLRVVVGTAVYTNSFTPQKTPLTAIPNTKFLSCQDPYFIIKSETSELLTETSDQPIISPFKYKAIGNGVPKSYYSDEGSGSYPAPSSFSPFVPKKWSLFTSNHGDYVYNKTSNSVFSFSNKPFTMEGWFYFCNVSSNFLGVTATGGIYLRTESGNVVSVGLGGVGTILTSTFALTSNNLNSWHHIAVARNDSNTMSIWVDGTRSNTRTYANSFTSNGYFYIGQGGPIAYYSSIRVRTLTFTVLQIQLSHF